MRPAGRPSEGHRGGYFQYPIMRWNGLILESPLLLCSRVLVLERFKNVDALDSEGDGRALKDARDCSTHGRFGNQRREVVATPA